MMSWQSWLISAVVRLSRVGPKVWAGGCSGGGSWVSSKVGGVMGAMVVIIIIIRSPHYKLESEIRRVVYVYLLICVKDSEL